MMDRDRYRFGLEGFEAVFTLGLIGLAIFFVVACVKDCKARKACEERGGTIIETNCRLVTNCHSDGHGHTTCTTQNVCDWHCDMRNAPAEAEDPR